MDRGRIKLSMKELIKDDEAADEDVASADESSDDAEDQQEVS